MPLNYNYNALLCSPVNAKVPAQIIFKVLSKNSDAHSSLFTSLEINKSCNLSLLTRKPKVEYKNCEKGKGLKKMALVNSYFCHKKSYIFELRQGKLSS